MRGDGFLKRRGGVWWYFYYRDGKPCRESLKTSDPKAAERMAKAIRDGILTGTKLPAQQRRVTVLNILEDFLVNLRLRKGDTTADRADHQLTFMKEALGHIRAEDLDTATIERYQAERLAADRAAKTVNNECAHLRQAFKLAATRKPPKVATIPLIPMLPVNNARQGFMARADFEALLSHIEDADIRDFLEWFWWTGMRPNEIRQLTWDMLNQETNVLHLDPKAAKIRRGRSIALRGPEGEETPLSRIIDRRTKARDLTTNLIFHRKLPARYGRHPIARFAAFWSEALRKANLPEGTIVYDLRRSAIRNMLRSGVHERTAMAISGHKTRSMFDRYNVTNEADISAAIVKTAAYVGSLPTARNVVAMPARAEKPKRKHRR